MISQIKKLFNLLTYEQRNKFYKLQILIFFMSIAEIVGIASMAPFMALIGNITVLDGSGYLAQIYHLTKLHSKEDFIFITGLFVLSIMTFTTLFSMLTTWKISLFASEIGVEISDRLFLYYMTQNWLFHTSNNSTQLTKKIANESGRMAILVISPLLQIGAKIIFTVLLSCAIFFYNPKIAITGLLIFSLSYIIIFKFVKKILKNNGLEISKQLTLRYKLMSEGFGSIKDVILMNRIGYYTSSFVDSGKLFSKSQGTNQALSSIPKYLMELIAFGSIILLILFLIKVNEGNLANILPALTIYALAGFKLLPSFQSIYSNLSHVRGNISSFEEISKDLEDSLKIDLNIYDKYLINKLLYYKSIEFKDICFKYPNKSELALNRINLSIPSNKVIGIVGPSGSGKSTFIDLLLGLIVPDTGTVEIDGNVLDQKSIKSFQQSIGFVPQSIYLTDGSITENIAIGLKENEIDLNKINHAIKLAHLEELINDYPNGLDTVVGERGVQLSGGQRQRIGIARALYNDPSILVFDEATSALDGITEKLIMDAIHDFSGSKTIIMIAHRLTTVEKCDIIYFIENGMVTDYGNYQELLNKNVKFKRMAENA